MGAHNVFAPNINFLDVNWEPKHITIGLFENFKIGVQTSLKKIQFFFKLSTTFLIQ
jgi:hypothetical protein